MIVRARGASDAAGTFGGAAGLPSIELDGERRNPFGDDADVVADALELDIRVAPVVFGPFCDPLNLATQAVNLATQANDLMAQAFDCF